MHLNDIAEFMALFKIRLPTKEDWEIVHNGIRGHVNGLPHICGQVIARSRKAGLCYLVTETMTPKIGHEDWIIKDPVVRAATVTKAAKRKVIEDEIYDV
jgi:hypothetical protein